MFRRSRAFAAKQVCIEGDSSGATLAIVGLLYRLGLRRSELVRLDAADLHSGEGVLTIQGKGNELRNADQRRYRLRFDHLIIPEWRIAFYARA
jgi:integrase